MQLLCVVHVLGHEHDWVDKMTTKQNWSCYRYITCMGKDTEVEWFRKHSSLEAPESWNLTDVYSFHLKVKQTQALTQRTDGESSTGIWGSIDFIAEGVGREWGTGEEVQVEAVRVIRRDGQTDTGDMRRKEKPHQPILEGSPCGEQQIHRIHCKKRDKAAEMILEV